jgi:hypothetical protein
MVWDVEEVIADCSHSPSRLQSIWESAPHLIRFAMVQTFKQMFQMVIQGSLKSTSPATSGEMDHTGLPTHPSHPGISHLGFDIGTQIYLSFV